MLKRRSHPPGAKSKITVCSLSCSIKKVFFCRKICQIEVRIWLGFSFFHVSLVEAIAPSGADNLTSYKLKVAFSLMHREGSLNVCYICVSQRSLISFFKCRSFVFHVMIAAFSQFFEMFRIFNFLKFLILLFLRIGFSSICLELGYVSNFNFWVNIILG